MSACWSELEGIKDRMSSRNKVEEVVKCDSGYFREQR